MKRMVFFLAIGFVLVLAVMPLKTVQANDHKEVLHFGIVPQQAASRLAEIWLPFIEKLSQETGLNIQFTTMKDIPTFEQCLAKGAYDLAYMNPYHYTVFHEKSGYNAIAHQANKKLKGLVVVRKDSPFKTLSDLTGQKIAFPSPAAFGASVLPRAEMQNQGIDFVPIYVKSHDSVYKSVAAGLFKAGGGVLRTFNSIDKELREQLRIIYETNVYTPHAFAIHPHIPQQMGLKIRDAMIKISVENPALIKNLGFQGIVGASDQNWDDVRQLGLSLEETEIEQQGQVICRFD